MLGAHSGPAALLVAGVNKQERGVYKYNKAAAEASNVDPLSIDVIYTFLTSLLTSRLENSV